jgi:hypothetical protein
MSTVSTQLPTQDVSTTGDCIGPDIPGMCPSIITGRALGSDTSAVIALVEHVLVDPALAEIAQG